MTNDAGKNVWEPIRAAAEELDPMGGCLLFLAVRSETSSYAYGYSDRASDVAFAHNTIFDIGSITKQFTAAAILKAQELGVLTLDQGLSSFLPEFFGEQITVHHLLTHSAGLDSNYGISDWEPVTREELIKRIVSKPLLSPPGDQYHYSNAGYSLLAGVLEVAFQTSYENVLASQILAPAGLTETGYVLPKWDWSRVAHNYSGEKDFGQNLRNPYAADGPFWNLRGNGGIHSTAHDLYRWHKALNEDAVLSVKSRELMFSPHVLDNEDGSSHYGYGWVISWTPRETKVIWHNGGDGVFSADFRRYVDEDLVLVAASNDATISASEINRIAAKRFLDAG